MRTFSRLLSRSAATVAALGSLALLSAAPASAQQSGGVSAMEVSAAKEAAQSPDTAKKLAHFFVQVDHLDSASALSTEQVSAEAATKQPKPVGEPFQVHSLNPKFVAQESDASVSRFAYLSMRAESATGQQATMWLTRGPNGWEASNITTGTEEVTFPAQANGDQVFTEPQINGWYRVHDGQVVPLNDSARKRVDAESVSLAGYQDLVHRAYGDKLPGSAYAEAGKLGGFQPAARASVSTDADHVLPMSLVWIGGGATIAVAAALVWRRRVSSARR